MLAAAKEPVSASDLRNVLMGTSAPLPALQARAVDVRGCLPACLRATHMVAGLARPVLGACEPRVSLPHPSR